MASRGSNFQHFIRCNHLAYNMEGRMMKEVLWIVMFLVLMLVVVIFVHFIA